MSVNSGVSVTRWQVKLGVKVRVNTSVRVELTLTLTLTPSLTPLNVADNRGVVNKFLCDVTAVTFHLMQPPGRGESSPLAL